jgi:hypothetical protein
MPCEGCPPEPNAINPREVANIIYTGGPPHAIFALVNHGIAADDPTMITKWSRPIVHSDGSLEYKPNETEPPELEGYRQDASNPRLLHPVWPHCVWRMLRVWREDTGNAKITAVCLTPQSGFKAHEHLTVKQCTDCKCRAT